MKETIQLEKNTLDRLENFDDFYKGYDFVLNLLMDKAEKTERKATKKIKCPVCGILLEDHTCAEKIDCMEQKLALKTNDGVIAT